MKQSHINFLTATSLLFLSTTSAQAIVVFSDDFNDGNTDGWTFSRTDATEWGVIDNRLNSSIGSDDGHDAVIGFASIDGITTPDHFKFDVDLSVNNYPGTADRGHVGLFWGAQDPASTSAAYNTTYLRTHSDHVTSWDTTSGGSYSGGELIYNVGSVTNGQTYHFSLEVDFINEIMISTFTNGLIDFSVTYTGTQFLQTSNWSGGSIGLIQWGEEVTYDNVVLQDLTVSAPEPSIAVLLAIGVVCIGLGRRKVI